MVTVGDCDFGEALRPVVAATREAVTNAAKHAGTGQVDVYAEVTDEAVDVFVRDRGRGFDPAATPEDRYGVRHSIIDRMQRHGGTGRDPVHRPARAPRCACTCPGPQTRKATTNDDSSAEPRMIAW